MNEMNKLQRVALSFLLLLIITGCATQPQQQKQSVIIGVSTMLSGDFASLGDNIAKSAELTLEQTPHEGMDIKLVIEDAGCAGGQGLTAAQKLGDLDGVQAIIGGTCSGDTLAAAP